MRKSYLKRFFGHLDTVLTHKRWVFRYASILGYTWRGLIHDMSKFSPVEFFESVKYWDGKRSPILAAKEDMGMSYGWLHHKGRNKHHYEYWVDNINDGGKPIKMPFKYVIEMVCDWLSACRTYENEKKNVFRREYAWWKACAGMVKIHDETKRLINKILWNLMEYQGANNLSERETLKIVKRFLPSWKREYDGN